MSVPLRNDFPAPDVGILAVKDAHLSHRLLAIAAVNDGTRRTGVTRIGSMDCESIPDKDFSRLGASFNADGPEGLRDI